MFTIAFLALIPAAEPVTVLRGGTVHDGSGGPGRVADVVIQGLRIVSIGEAKVPDGARVLDVKGLIVAPGFIDLHTHSDDQLTRATTRGNLNYLRQGVTTVITGNCGSGPVDVSAYFKKLRDGGVGSNVIHLMPHNSIRRQVVGNVDRPPTADELEKMAGLVEKGMKDGAWGLSTGLIYNPGTYARTDEIIALAKAAGKHGGLYASHIRNEGINVLSATEEALTIGREARVPVHISHMKASGEKAWGKSADQIALVLKARKAGQVVTADQYPYVASSTSLSATVIPTRFREGSQKDFLARLDDPETGPKVRKAVEDGLDGRRPSQIRIARYSKNPAWQGKSLADIAKEEKKQPVDIVLEIERNGGAGIVNFGMNEEDVRLIMKQDFVATASDGSSQVPSETVPHPRSYGTFPRKIGRYALEDGVVKLEHAIRSCSGLPADILGLKERGYVKPNCIADVVVFDPKTYRDVGTFDKPHQYAKGVRYLFVNGACAIDDGEHKEKTAGKVLTRQNDGK